MTEQSGPAASDDLVLAAAALTVDDAAIFFREKQGQRMCHRCGNGTWEIFVPTEQGLVNFQLASKPSNNLQIGRQAIPCIFTVCHNCGLLEFYAAFSVAQWKLKKEPR